jgi:hypothetical protein
MKNFIKKTKSELTKRLKSSEVIPMTVFNLAYDEKEMRHQVFIHEFKLKESVSQNEKLNVIKNCILGAEWETKKLGLINKCTVYGESLMKDGNKCLFIQTKYGKKETAEFHVFEEVGMSVNQNGEFEIGYNELNYKCNLSNQK